MIALVGACIHGAEGGKIVRATMSRSESQIASEGSVRGHDGGKTVRAGRAEIGLIGAFHAHCVGTKSARSRSQKQ